MSLRSEQGLRYPSGFILRAFIKCFCKAIFGFGREWGTVFRKQSRLFCAVFKNKRRWPCIEVWDLVGAQYVRTRGEGLALRCGI